MDSSRRDDRDRPPTVLPVHREVGIGREHGRTVVQLGQPHEASVGEGHRSSAYLRRSRPRAPRSPPDVELHPQEFAQEEIDEPLEPMTVPTHEMGYLGEDRLAGQTSIATRGPVSTMISLTER